MRAVTSRKIFTLIGYFCRKYVMFELKKYWDCVVKNNIWFQKWHKSFGEFLHKKVKVMLDKSSVYVLAERMYFWTKIAHQISTIRTFYYLS